MTFEVCEKFFNNWQKKTADGFLVFLRLVFGAFFFNHGLPKLAQAAWSFMWIIGVLEILVGAAIVLGIFARSGAIIGAIIMIGTFPYVHFSNGFNPFTNGGESALLYLAVFLVISAYGPGKLALGKKVFGKAKF